MLEICTSSRLHFGLMELCPGRPLQFGGLGLMLDTPQLQLELTGSATQKEPAIRFDGEQTKKVRQVIARRRRLAPDSVYPQEILLQKQLPLHHGLGSGTQLACAVALGLEVFDRQHRQGRWQSGRWHGYVEAMTESSALAYEVAETPRPLQWLIEYSGRGLRSAVGLVGFLSGGLILDYGYQPTCMVASSRTAMQSSAQTLSDHPLKRIKSVTKPKLVGQSGTAQVDATQVTATTERQPIPTGSASRPVNVLVKNVVCDWRVVTIRPVAQGLISGAAEARLLASVGRRQNPRREQMFELAERVMRSCDQPSCFDDFVDSLETYLHLAGQMFEAPQGGIYNGPEISAVVRCGQLNGLRAVGQSSWGPTVFGFCHSQAAAESAMRQILKSCAIPLADVAVTRPAATGARFRFVD